MQGTFTPTPIQTARARRASRFAFALAAVCLLHAVSASALGANGGAEKDHAQASHGAYPTPAFRPPKAGGARAGGRITVEGIEVIQAIQDIETNIPLVAGKATLVRTYLRYEGAGALTVRGELAVARRWTAR